MEFAQTLEEWAKDKPLSILQLDPADRAVLRIADERDAIQKKTFTKWVNKHLTKDWRRAQRYLCFHVCTASCLCDTISCGKRVGDLFEDLRDGHNLVSLLEVLAGEHLPRERGRMRFHMLQNVQTVLDFLRYRKIKLVNIRAEDIVDGNPKLTLGLIWTIILHFQISDIVVGMEENVSARDALLKWAQKSTAKYPGVRVGDFTNSWRDGLAFNAIIHRNRPDLIDWRALQRRSPRERLETAFSVAERECGVTRLLDPEDVDTPQPDEKSLITYISSMYDAFPEPPRLHPLYDTDSQKKWEEYRETATTLYSWIRESITVMQDRNFSSSLIEMRRMASDMNRFRVEEIPTRAHSKQRLSHLFRDVEKHFRDGEIDRELHVENIERSWQVLMMSHQEKDQAIHDEIKKLDKLLRIAEKIHRETKQVESRLDDHEQRIDEEARRIDRLHPLDAKNNVDHLERDMQMTEETIKSLFIDTQVLSDARFQQAPELNRMVQHLHQRWISIRKSLQTRLQSVLASISFGVEEKSVSRMSKTVLETRLVETDANFRNVLEVAEWIKNKQKQLNDEDYGSDLPSVQAELEKQQKEHRVIERYETNIDRCSAAKSSFRGEELQLYINYLSNVQKSYSELLMSSKKRHSDLETLMDFVQSATNELIWLSEKEEREITRDWSSKTLNLVEVEQYYESLMSELEKREIQFNAVQDRGESLVLQHHPASKCIETYMSSMQTQWAWLLQLTLCLETHLKYVATYQQYFSNVRDCEQSIARQEELLNSIFSKADFTLDEGEILLKEMQELRDELTRYGDFVQGLTNESGEIIPLKQRKTNVSRPLTVTAICSYKQNNQQMIIAKDERCVLLDNSQRVRWRIRNSSGLEGMVPGVCFLIPPPDKEALEASDRIRKQYDRCVTLWQKKQLKMRQNMIFATIKVVKSWDLTQFLGMGSEQRNAIRKALNEDAEKLIQEGDPNDPALRRLRREINEVNRLFDQFEKQALDAEKSKNTSKVFSEQVHILQTDLDDAERTLVNRVNAVLPRDIDNLERMVVEHKDFETKLQTYESRVQTVQRTYSSIPQKTAPLQAKLEKVVEKWERIWDLSHLYVERLKCVEVVLGNLEEATTMVSKFEMKLGSYENIPTEEHEIRRVSDDLFNLQHTAQVNQHVVEQLVEDTKNVRHVVEKSRGSQKRHPDVEKLEDEVHRTTTRWSNASLQIVDRLRTVEQAAEMATPYNSLYQKEMKWLDTIDTKTKSLPLMESGRARGKIQPHMTLYNSVIEEKITIEQVNTMGARLAKEAKTYDTKLEEFRDRMQEVHPSLDGSLVKKPKVESATEVITNHLDLLNLKYQVLVDNLYHRLYQLSTNVKQEDPSVDFSISKVPAPSPLRTYRVTSRDPTPKMDEDTVDNIIQRSSAEITLAAAPTPKKRSIIHLKNGDTNGNTGEPNGNDDLISPLSPKLHFSQIRSIRKTEEGISTETAILVPLLIDPLTGEKLTLAQAIGCGLIDIKTGKFVDNKTNRRMSLPEAAEHGYILDSGILQKLIGVCGLVDPQTRNEITLLDAIRLGWYDLSKGCFINPKTGEPMSSEQAIRLGIQTQSKVSSLPPDCTETTSSDPSVMTRDPSCTSSLPSPPLFIDLVRSGRVDVNSGQVVVGSRNLPISDAVAEGLVQYESEGKNDGPNSTLSDLIDQGLVSTNPKDGTTILKNLFSGEVMSMSGALDAGLLQSSTTEIFNPKTLTRVTLAEAIKSGVLDLKEGIWKDERTNTSLPLETARKNSLIMKPLSLKDYVDLDLCGGEGVEPSELLTNPVTKEKHSIYESIADGTLDVEMKTVTDAESDTLVNLQEALAREIVTAEGLVKDTRTGAVYTVRDASNRGLLSAVKRTSVFNIPCIVDPGTRKNLSIMEALETGVINPNTMTVKVDAGKEPVNFDEAATKKLISPQMFETLNAPSGIYDPKTKTSELSILEAIVSERILPSGEFFDETTGAYVPMDIAVENGVLDEDKANLLQGLYNVNLTTATVTKTIRHVITLQSTEETLETGRVGFQEALQKKLIDVKRGTFKDPSTGEESSVEEAITNGLLGLSSDWPGDEFETNILDKRQIPVAALNRELLHLPPNGWPLREMISNELLEPIEGLFAIPGTDRLVSFEECVRLNIIDPYSAEVIDSNNGRRVPLLRSLEKQILDRTGHYYYSSLKSETPMTLQEAIACGAVILLPEDSDVIEKPRSTSDLELTPMEVDASEAPRKVKLSDPEKKGTMERKETELNRESSPIIQVTESMTFDPNSATVRDVNKNEEIPLFDAILSGRIEPRKVKVRDLMSGEELNINEAMRKGIVDKKTGMVKLKARKGRQSPTPMSFSDAVKFGTISVVAAPLLAVKMLAEKVSDVASSVKTKPITASPLRQRSVTPDRLSSATLTAVPEECYVVSEEIIPYETVVTTTTVTTETVFVTKISRLPMDPEELMDSGLVDNSTLQAISNPENFIGPNGERLTLKEAIEQGKIDGNSGALLDPQTQQLLTINEAILQNILTHQGNIVLPISRSLSIPELKTQGLYDAQEEKVIHPETGTSLTILEAMASDILNPFSPVTHPVSRRRLSLAQALEQNVVCKDTGSVLDPEGPIPLLQAVKTGSYEEIKHPWDDVLPLTALTMEVAVKRGLADLEAKTLRNPATDEEIPIEQAIDQGQLIPTTLETMTPNESLTTDEPKQTSVPVIPIKKIRAKKSKPPTPIRTSALKVTFKEPEKPKPKERKIVVPGYTQMDNHGLLPLTVEVDLNSGHVKIPATGGDYTLAEAIEKNVFDPNVIVEDETGEDMTLKEAVEHGLDLQAAIVRDPDSGARVSFSDALKMGLLAVVGAPVVVGMIAAKALRKANSSQETAEVKERLGSSLEALPPPSPPPSPIKGIEIKSQLKKPKTPILKAEVKPLLQADVEEEVVEDMSEFLSQYQKPYPLHVAVALGKYNPYTGLLQIQNTGEYVTLQDGIKQGEIDPHAITCRDPRTDSLVTLKSALASNLVDPKSGQMIDPISGAELNLDDAMKAGLLLTPTRRISLPEILYAGNYDPETNQVYDAISGESIPLKTAIEDKIITTDSMLVKNFGTEAIIPFRNAVSEGLVDLDDGTVRISPTTVANIIDALESGVLIEVKPLMSLSETIHKGLHREEDGKFLDPKTGKYVTLSEALKKKIIDPETVHVKDTREGFDKKMPLTVAIHSGFMSGDTGSVHDFTKNNDLPLLSALETGLIIDSRMPISVQKAIHLGLYSEDTGKLTDPNTGRRVTLHEAIRRLIVNPILPCYWDEDEGKILSLVETCRVGIIGRQEGVFHVPKTEPMTTLNLSDALYEGYILNIEKPFSLYEAIRVGLYEKKSGKFLHPATGRKLTLEESCKQELIKPEISILKNSDTSKIVSLPLAVSQGLVDPITGTYNQPRGERNLSLDEAKKKGLVLTIERPLSLERIVEEHLYRGDTGRIGDPLLCEWITTEQGLKTGLIDSKRTAIQNLGNQRIKSLRAGLDDGEVDSETGTVKDARTRKAYPFDAAIKKGLILSVDPPMTFSDGIKTQAIDLRRGTFCDPRTAITSSLAEAVANELIDPSSAVVRNPQTHHFLDLRQAARSGLIELKKRAMLDPESGKLKPLCIIFEQGTVVFLREPMTFDIAREKGYLNLATGQFHDPVSESVMSLKEAVDINAIDPNSAVIKDVLKKRLVPLAEGFTLALIDPDKSTVFNSANNHLVPLNIAVESGLVLTPRTPFGLITALDYSLYNPLTGKFHNPYQAPTHELTLNESLSSGLIEPNTTVIREPVSRRILPLTMAIEERIVDAEEGTLFDPSTSSRQNLHDAWKEGLVVRAEARLATEEKYRTCTSTINNLSDWLLAVEKRLGSQENVRETLEEIKKQLSIVKQIQDDIEDHRQPIGSCLDQMRQLVATGGEILSVEEISTLEKNGKQLKTRFDRVSDQSEKLDRKLTTAADELRKYKTEVTSFKSWMDKSFRILEEKERNVSNLSTSGRDNTKEFVSDVIAHQGDLRFITMSAQKFIDESRDYVQTLNDFRVNLPQRLPYLEVKDSVVKREVTEVTHTYQDLLNRANKLFDRLSSLGNMQKEFQDAFNKAAAWLKEVTPRAQKILSEPISGEPKLVEDQLSRAKAFQNEILSSGRLIDAVRQATNNLVNTVEDLTPEEKTSIEGATKEVENRYQDLVEAMGDKVKGLDSALIQTQDVQDAVDNVTTWLAQAENQLKLISKPASLIRERLDEQIREVKLLQADIESHRVSIETMARSADKLINSGSRVSKKVEGKLQDVLSRYEKLVQKLVERTVLLNEVSSSLNSFEYSATHFEQWFLEMFEVIETKLGGENAAVVLDDVMKKKQSKKPDFDELISSAKILVSRKDVTDTTSAKDRIKSLEQQWKDLNGALDEKNKLNKARSESLNAYEKLREQVTTWLNTTEMRVGNLKPVALDVDIIKHQVEELKPIMKEYRDYNTTIDKVNELGVTYEVSLRGDRAESPRRRLPSSPTKRSSFRSTESPTKSTSPSPFGSRRSSQEPFVNLEDESPIQNQLNEINNRYNLIGMKLSDRQTELDSTRDEVKKIGESLKSLAQFLDKEERLMPKDSIPQTRDEADKTLKAVKNILEELYEKQGLLDSAKAQLNDLLRRKPSAQGADALSLTFDDLNKRWKALQDNCKQRVGVLENIKEFHDSHDNLNNWLNAKDKMMGVLGPIASDPRMVQSQLQQVQVMRDEFRAQKPVLDSFNNSGDQLLVETTPNSPDERKIEDKLANINQNWNDLLHKLDDREGNLDAASGASSDFYNNLNKLQDNLHKISDDLDDLSVEKGKLDPEELLKKLQAIDKALESQRPVLADVQASGEQLCDILTDPTSRADIKQKLAQVGRLFNQCQKKLDNCKAELENSKKDASDFDEACEAAQDWLADILSQLSEKLLVSADREILMRQVAEFEPIYKDVMGKEHEIIMTINKGKELAAAKSTRKNDQRTITQNLEKVQKGWEKLKKETMERNTRLQTCGEHCRKYDKARDTFLKWLTQAEDKFESFKLNTFKKQDVDKQLKEMNTFKNDLWRHTSEFETTRSLGDTFLASCDKDKQGVTGELRDMRERWEALNNGAIAKVQELEDASARLSEFNDNVRDVKNALNRCEDRLASADDTKDPKLLQKIQAIVDEAVKLEHPLETVKNQGDDLCKTAQECECNSDHIKESVDDLMDRYDLLKSKLDDRGTDLEVAQRAMAQFNEQLKNINADLGNLEDELNCMKPIARDIPTVKSQIREVENFSDKLHDKRADLEAAFLTAEDLIRHNLASDGKGMKNQLENLTKQLTRLDDKSKQRETDLNKTLEKLEGFYDLLRATDDEIKELVSEEKTFNKGVGGDVESIRAQQAQFKEFREKYVEGVGKEVDECNKIGQGLIQSAANGVNTSDIEKDLEQLNDKWNALKEKINDQERKLDVALLNSGKFQEALEGLNKWLNDIEDMVANQKPPSADFKVVKAQLQEQKFLNKMLLDRQPSVASLFKMGKEIAANADPKERKHIEGQMANLGERYDSLCNGAKDRQQALEAAMDVAKEFQDKLTPLSDWLDKTGKKIKDMSLIPTDENEIQKRIREHDALHDGILGKQPEFTSLADIAAALMELVGDEEASVVADKLQDLTERYGNLVEESEALGKLLKQAKGALRHLVLSYEELIRWMDDMNKRLSKYKVLSVHKDKLLHQMDQIVELTEEIKEHEKPVDGTIESGLELMKSISNDEAIQLKDKLDSLQRRFTDITNKASELLKNTQDALPLVTQFHDCHNNLSDWMSEAESTIQGLDNMSMGAQEKEIGRLEREIVEQRKDLEAINLVGPQLCQLSPGEGASTIEGLVTRDNRRYDAICEQVQRRAERINMAKQRSMEVLGDIDDLLEWFREIEGQIKDAEKPSCEPDIVRIQLQEHRSLSDEIASQKGRVRDVLATAKKVLREATQGEDTAALREKAEDLKEMMDSVSKLSSERLNALEQALPLAEHFVDTHNVLNQWMDGMEDEMATLDSPALRPDQIMKLQDKTQAFQQAINEHKPLVDKLNKTAGALMRLCNDDDAGKVDEVVHADNERYNALKVHLREKQQALEKALQETSQFKDKLDGMLNALESTADQVNNAEPISAHPDKIREQIDENAAIIDDIKKREAAFNAVKKQASDVISKAPNKNDPAVKDIKQKLDRLNSLWDQIQKATMNRGKNLDEALVLSEKFWAELQAIMEKLDALQDTLKSQEPPAVEPKAIQKQQDVLQNIKKDIEKVKPDVSHCRHSGQNLMKIVGDHEKPEIKKNIEDLDYAWDNITALFAKREENLIDAMEKAMEFHETLHSLLKFLDKAEQRLAEMGGIGADIDAVKSQIKELNDFKSDVDPMMVKVEALNRQAQELTERTSPDQAAKIKGPLAEVNRRWEDLLKGIVERQRELENALLRLGQFQHALNELMAWIEKTNKSLDTLKPVFGDPQVIEVELAKLKVLVNDIQAHQNSVDTLNDAGRQIIESEKGTDNASKTQQKLNSLNKKWDELQRKALDRQKELEDALHDAQAFAAEIQDLLFWLNDIDGALSTSKPVGGLPETASEQLARFMEIYHELETNRPKVEAVLQQGQEYLKKSTDGAATNLAHNLKTLRQRWENVMVRANDKKIKLEIALKEANEFHKAVQDFIDWLTEAERYLTGLEPVSRVLDKVLDQVDSHKDFQKEVSSHREVMLTLEKKGNHLKYFSQKQDVILIKNLLISVQHRWDRVVSKSTERTRGLDLGLKEAKEFHENWASLCKWLDEAEKNLDEMFASAGNNPVKIKQMLVKHKEFQRILASKQPTYDGTMRMGKSLKDKAPKADEPILRQMLTELKNKWNAVCNKSIERQRNLEEALLRSGQFKDALQELLDWLKHIDSLLVDDGPVFGDLDTVISLIEQHKKLEDQVEKRRNQMRDIVSTAEEIMATASAEEKSRLAGQIKEVKSSFDKIKEKCENKSRKLEEALKEAEKLHKSVHMLLEWLSDAEMRLRLAGSLPEDEESIRKLLEEQEKFMRELFAKEREKDETIDLAKIILAKAHPDAIPVIKHWISIIQTRWDEISSWAKQRQNKLQGHLASLRDMEDLLDELMKWLQNCEDELTRLEAVPLPDDLALIQGLIKDHKEFMEGMAKRQPEVDSVCKPKTIGKPSLTKGKPGARLRSQTPGGDSREPSPDLDFAQRRLSSPGRDRTPELFPHIGPRFDRRGSKAVEPQIKNPRVKAMWDKWKHVWMMAWERQRRLQDKHNYLLELEKVKNFSWDDWRKRFLKFMNYKKSRVTDIFRKIDRNNNGLIPREEFMNAIMKTKFPTSRLEMNAVADMFDHGDHMIDYMEFIAALRPDWEEKKPEAEVDVIDDEVQRQVMKCTCRQKFRVFQVGEGKYRFGDSQKLRLVRILRSTVMVRVGGGWVALDEFLVKNDPCRAKGRTNIELREQFILAEGVSQTMQAFKSRPSGSTVSSGNRSAQSLPTAGPITKVKERSIRSVPMGRARSTDRTTPDSTFGGRGDDGFTLSRVPRKPSTGPGRGSTPGSRTGSKPPSRSGSNVSLDSTDDRGSRIPRRSTSLKRGTSGSFGSTPPSSRTPSRPPFSLNTNVNGSRAGSSERALSFTRPPSTTPRGGLKRTGSASSVHSLPPTPGSGTRPSRIPVFVGGDAGDFYTPNSILRSRTPSNSNIPVVTSTPTRDRTPSGTANVSFNLPSPSTTSTSTTAGSSSPFSPSPNVSTPIGGSGIGPGGSATKSSNLRRSTSGSTDFSTTKSRTTRKE